jgi:uroporphyrinogen decarboxylase
MPPLQQDPMSPDGFPRFLLDPAGNHQLMQLGWCEAAFSPEFEVKVIEDRGDTEVVQDVAGRHVLYFKGRRHGFMPTYLTHPVKDQKTWEENVKWRLDPDNAERRRAIAAAMPAAVAAAQKGLMITQCVIGGCMFLRSLMGPEDFLFALHDQPQLLHDCMKTWLRLSDAVIAEHQRHVTLDEIFFGEDICYNHGPLMAPAMIREYLFPYYQQLLANAKSRQIDRQRHLYVQLDTDGDCRPVIQLYADAIGMDVMSPFEVASGCDVVELGRQYPNLVMRGGIDKRQMAKGRAAIDRMLERIIPAMRARGGYIPCCDHGVPPEVPYEDYLYYRRRCVELGG